MDLRTFRYVLAIAEHQSLTKAAEALYVGQPTLSKFLSALEAELGVPLFQRLGHRYLLTYAGERYVERARQILQVKKDLDAELTDIRKRDVGILRIAFAPVRCSYLLPGALTSFQKRYPDVKILVMDGDSEGNDRRLLAGEADLAFYSMPAERDPRIEYENLAQEELLLCTCPEHPFAQRAVQRKGSAYPWVDLGAEVTERILLMKPEQRTRQILDSALRENGIHLKNTVCISNMQAIMGLVSAGYGASFILDAHLKHRLDQRPVVCFRYGREKVLGHFAAAYRKGSYLPHYAKDFIEMVRAQGNAGTGDGSQSS